MTDSSISNPESNTVQDNFDYVEGRRFNTDKDVQYLLPNDDDEANRLHMQHWIFRYALQCNFHAPVKEKLEEGISVIDSGCGPASWTTEMAETYPNSKFTGVDISFVSSEEVKFPNLTLQTCNITKTMPFSDESFDYYHQRLLIAGLSKNDYEAALINAYKLLKPGGYIELVEPNLGGFTKLGPIFSNLLATMSSVMGMRGMSLNLAESIEGMVRNAGFEDIVCDIRVMPINHTNKIGQLWWKDIERGYNNIRPMLALLNPEFDRPENYRQYLDSIADECSQMKTDSQLYIVYARKPLAD